MNWVAVIGALAQVLFIVISDWSRNSKREKEEKDALKKEWDEAISSGDKSRITAFLDKLRK